MIHKKVWESFFEISISQTYPHQISKLTSSINQILFFWNGVIGIGLISMKFTLGLFPIVEFFTDLQ